MKNLVLAATAALFSFAAAAQTGAPTVAGQTPADGRTYGQAVSTAARAKNDKYSKAPKPAKLAKPEKLAKPYTEEQKAAYNAQQEARKEAYKAQTQQQKDAYKAQETARKETYKAQHEAAKDADKVEKHERSARGEHAHNDHGLGHAKAPKEHKMK
ncbi:hypothetical protein AUC43_08660 [Hymenobacter sedentarius]|uniref:Uncharacterized protein n=1 Tax=Hymenobacter sedentarius TaxID=1411621 RepID=A0A0U4ANN8_9BACT|nr:hypothetical protein [Hymenobacter sedentarius]ALW85157.1 hypothetical protein AUC43_08660 [Hymenobacter sedentarius]